ncbi:hypothetical protein [Helicobacter sp.]|uniref:hypothetical protein n=1 Tax=Helicobacter sp. TaxID=218 RepID=UPI0019CAB4E1|nr:hypothetical protein [Helicobacter sp.]MBD5165150.1 hypothetical protein [Helicobacter sp.]
MNPDFELLLKLKELEKETNFHFVIDKDNAEIYLFEPNSKEYFDKINIQKELKEIENANPIKQSDSTSVERYTRNVIGRIRGIIGKRIARSSEIQTGSRSICEGRESICGVNGDEIWRRDFDARVSLQELQVREQNLKKTNHLIRQSEYYKQQALKAYQQNGVTLTPKNLVTSSLNKEDSSNNSNHQENSSNQSNQSKLFSNFKNKLNNIHQNLTNPTNTISLKDTLEIDKSQDNQESQDSYLKTQYQIKRRRK